jgi:hypothetical protein
MQRLRSWHVITFFGLFLLLGLAIVDDYGVSWDESIQRRHGRVSIDYAAEKLGLEDHVTLEPDWYLEDYQWSNYGMVYSISANLLEQRLGLEASPYQYYRLRHILAFLLFWVASIYFYRTLRIRFPDRQWYPLIGTLALIMSPRIFAHAFFNPKDHILVVFYIIAIFTLLRFLKNRTWKHLILHAVATGLALNTRLPALVIPLTTVSILGWELLRDWPKEKKNLIWIVSYLPLSIAFMIPFFPFLWEDTLHRLVGAFSEMSAFEWDSYVLLFGDSLSALDLPAYYIPAWIIITTPIVYLLFMFSGIYATLRNLTSSLKKFRFWKSDEELLDFAQLGLTIGPILVVILLGSTLYNGWRHLHFVYPGLIFLMMVGFDYWANKQARTRVPAMVLGAGLALTAVNMVRYHPHQNVFFNTAIQGKPLMERFDMDYWGVGFRDALLQLADQIPDGEVRSIKCDVWPCKDNFNALPPTAKTKLRLEDAWHRADFLVTNFPWSTSKNAYEKREDHFARPVVEVTPGGHISVGIYELKQTH